MTKLGSWHLYILTVVTEVSFLMGLRGFLMWHYQKLFDFCCLLDVKKFHSISLVSSINSSDILS